MGTVTTNACTPQTAGSTTLNNTTLVLEAGTYLLNGKAWFVKSSAGSAIDITCSLVISNNGVFVEADTTVITVSQGTKAAASFLLADTFNFQATATLTCCAPSGFTYSDPKLIASTVGQVSN